MLLNALPTQELVRTQFINVLWSICCTYSFWGKKILWEISMKSTTFEESIGNENANSERKEPDPKLGMM